MTTRELAVAADVPISTLNIILTGKRWRNGVATIVKPKEVDVARLAMVLPVSQEELDAIGYFYASQLISQETFGFGDGIPDRNRSIADRRHGRIEALVDMLEKFTDHDIKKALEIRSVVRGEKVTKKSKEPSSE